MHDENLGDFFIDEQDPVAVRRPDPTSRWLVARPRDRPGPDDLHTRAALAVIVCRPCDVSRGRSPPPSTWRRAGEWDFERPGILACMQGAHVRYRTPPRAPLP